MVMRKSPLGTTWSKSYSSPSYKLNPFNIVTENTPKAFLEIVHRPKISMKVPDIYEKLNLKDIKKLYKCGQQQLRDMVITEE